MPTCKYDDGLKPCVKHCLSLRIFILVGFRFEAMDTSANLRQRLIQAVSSICPDQESFSSLALSAVLSHYPARPYHNLHHLVSMFAWLDAAYQTAPIPPCVSLAVLFHDIVYDPTRHDNEEKSAKMFEDMASALPRSIVEDTSALILATIRHHPVPRPSIDKEDGDWEDCKLFLDADLSILASSSSSYNNYARGIRLEYSHLDDLSYRTGRVQVLHTLLSRPRLYHSIWSLEHPDEMEDSARSNLAREIQSLMSH